MNKIFEIIPKKLLPENPEVNACMNDCKHAKWLWNEVEDRDGNITTEAKCYCHSMYTFTWGNGNSKNIHVCMGNPEFVPDMEKIKHK